MFSIADMAVAGAVALLLFGPDQLPKVARRAGQLVRDVQNTSQSFIREMERAADTPPAAAEPYAGPPYPPIAAVPPYAPVAEGTHDPGVAEVAPAAPAYHATPDPAPHELVAKETAIGPFPGLGERSVPENRSHTSETPP